ncbi:MAG TPA: molybdopterin cofactor-binding domain-containing protein [Sphingomicrobium sp.]|nr:molybdopterin cofactor-binding domain-containing protein [Sphingomicrobium sp.]
MKLDRRSLLIGGGAGVGLVVAFSLWPRRLKSDLAVRPGEQAFGAFIKISRDGKVTVAVPQVETGQGIWTGLPQIVADELGAAWETVAVEPAPFSETYANPMAKEDGWPVNMRITADSTSVRAFERPMREAAAIARAMLIGAAADRWNLDPAKCDTADGFIISGVRTLTFGEVAEEAAGRKPPGSAPLRGAQKGRLFGQPLERLDGPAKAQGSWRFAGDVRLPGLLYASARLAPPHGRLASFARDAIAHMPGIRHLSANDAWIAVVADSWWQAEQALKAADVRFTGESTATDVHKFFEDALANGTPREWFRRGKYEETVRGSRPLAATYYAAPAPHLQLDPVSATAHLTDAGVDLWVAAQAPRTSPAYSALYPMPSGDPSGRAMDPDAAPIAIELARAVRGPVQVTLSQSSSQNHDRVSAGAVARMTALPGAGGITAAMAIKVATADALGSALRRIEGKDARADLGQTALDGAIPPYSIPDVLVETIAVKPPFAIGYVRGSPQREFAFFTESFVDELAHTAGIEPLAFRMSMLGGNTRLARCLQAAAQLAGWDGGSAGSTMGIAGASAFGSHIGLVATASIAAGQRIKVHRLVAAVDCGRVVNPSLVEQQIEGGLIWAFAQATVSAPEWIAGMPRARPIGGIDLPRLADTPEIVVQILSSAEESGGVSGLGTLPVAPAVANAIHAGSGKRMRSLPFDAGVA